MFEYFIRYLFYSLEQIWGVSTVDPWTLSTPMTSKSVYNIDYPPNLTTLVSVEDGLQDSPGYQNPHMFKSLT